MSYLLYSAANSFIVITNGLFKHHRKISSHCHNHIWAFLSISYISWLAGTTSLRASSSASSIFMRTYKYSILKCAPANSSTFTVCEFSTSSIDIVASTLPVRCYANNVLRASLSFYRPATP